MEDILLRRLGGASIDYTARVTESVLARLHFVLRMPVGEAMGEVDVRALEKELTLATRSWNDEFADMIADADQSDELATLVGALPEGYKEDYTPRQAVQDLTALTTLAGDHDMSMAMYAPSRAGDEADLRLKIFRRDASMSLSKILPHLTLLGVDVIDERPYELALGNDERAFIYDFGVTVPGGAEAVRRRWTTEARQQFMDAFSASYGGLSEPDGFNALVMGADLGWRDVSLLRAIGRYLRQVGVTYSQTYIAQALSANVDIARQLVTLVPDPVRPGAATGPGCSGGPGRRADRQGSRRRSTTWPASTTTGSSGRSSASSPPSSGPTSTPRPGRRSRSSCCRGRSPNCPHRGRSSRSSSTRRGWKGCICASARSPAAGCAGRIGPRTSGPRSSAWSRPRW